MDKTNVMRILDKSKVPYESFEYSQELTEGVQIAEILNQDKTRVFKTLVTESNTKQHFVFVIPVAETLDLKSAARAVGAKSVSMLSPRGVEPLTVSPTDFSHTALHSFLKYDSIPANSCFTG